MTDKMFSFQVLILAAFCATIYVQMCAAESNDVLDDDMITKSIIYDKKTPDVFYCPLEKFDGINNMLVKAIPIHRLCEYQGGPKPKGYRRDCYNDVDETDFACKERKRIMKRAYPPGMEVLEKYKPISRSKRAEYYSTIMKNNKL